MKKFEIYIEWDAETEVWFVSKSDVPGLNAEAATQAEMLEILKELVPELVVANVFSRSTKQSRYKEVPFSLIARKDELVAIGC